MELIIYAFIFFVFGLVFGSFYNVLAYRLPNEMSVVAPPSHCPKCNKKLRFYELIPVISYVIQLGKCRNCKNKISIIYPIFELITGVAFALCYIKFGLTLELAICITFVSTVIIITNSDLKYMIIPDEVLIVASTFLIILFFFLNLENNSAIVSFNLVLLRIFYGILAFIIMLSIKLIGDKIFKKETLGGGDIKLMFLIGLIIGIEMSIVTIFVASFLALPVAIIILIIKNDHMISYGPFLIITSFIFYALNINIDQVLDLLIR